MKLVTVLFLEGKQRFFFQKANVPASTTKLLKQVRTLKEYFILDKRKRIALIVEIQEFNVDSKIKNLLKQKGNGIKKCTLIPYAKQNVAVKRH